VSLSELLTRVGATASAYTQRFLDSLRGFSVPVASWTSLRNTGLALTNLLGDACAEAGAIVAGYLNGQSIDTATGEYLTKTALSQYRLTRYPSVAAQTYFLLQAASTAPPYTLVPGQVVAGVVGGPALYTGTDGVSIAPGGKALMAFSANTPGVAGNIASGVALSLRTALPGLSVAATSVVRIPGSDVNGDLVVGVLPGMGPIGITGVIGGVSIVVSVTLGSITVTFPAGTTAGAIAAALNVDAAARLLVHARALGTGATAARAWPAALFSSPIVTAGQEEEADGTVEPPSGLRGRCVLRWATVGYGATAEALLYWAFALPATYTASPVTKARIYSNRLADGTISGNCSLAVVAGSAGALSAADLAAVAANYESPSKYGNGIQFACITTTNLTIAVVGTVFYYAALGVSPTAIAAAVAARFAAYTAQIPVGGFPGGVVRADRVKGQVEAASDVIDTVVLTAPTVDTAVTWRQSVVFDLTGLLYVAV